MPRQKEIIDQELVLEAKKQLGEFEEHRIYLRLFAIIKAGEYPITEVAMFLGVSSDTVSRWIKRFRAQGLEGLHDRPRGHNPSKLTEEHKQQISYWLDMGRGAQGDPIYWTLEKLRAEIKKRFGITISIMPLWLHLRKMGYQQGLSRQVQTKDDEKVLKNRSQNQRTPC